MENQMPKIIAAHDLSGVGTASLGAVMPILSVMGSYVCPLQTATLSTITGVFLGYSFTDLTKHMQDTIKHWQQLDLQFDYIYSGFLGSAEQVEIIKNAKRTFNCTLMVDPVFADNGQLYPTMDNQMVLSMRDLVSNADIITPNITEAMYLLNEKSVANDYEQIKDWLMRLSKLGPNIVVITGCNINGEMYVCCYNKEEDKFDKIKCCYYSGSFHGTGDIFASVMLGAIARGQAMVDAINLATEFVSKAILTTIESNSDPKLGVAMEKVMRELL